MWYLVGMAVSIWMMVYSGVWTEPQYWSGTHADIVGHWTSAGLELGEMVSLALSLGSLCRGLLAARRVSGSADQVIHHVLVSVLSLMALSGLLVVDEFGTGLSAIQGLVLVACGSLLAWSMAHMLLVARGYAVGSWRTDLALASAAGGSMTLAWIYGLPALRYLASHAMTVAGISGMIGFGLLGLMHLDVLDKRRAQANAETDVLAALRRGSHDTTDDQQGIAL